MKHFIYRCPKTGLNVQGSVGDEKATEPYVAQTCLACGSLHFVSPGTGKLMSEEQRRDLTEAS